jgi:hypothetical protein
MVFDDGPFPYGRMKVFVVPGDGFIPTQLFTDKQEALAACIGTACVLEYVQCVRNQGKMRLTHRHHQNGTTERLWATEDTDYHVIYTSCPVLNDLFKYDEYDDVAGVKWDHPCISLLKDNLHSFPKWFVSNLERRAGWAKFIEE